MDVPACLPGFSNIHCSQGLVQENMVIHPIFCKSMLSLLSHYRNLSHAIPKAIARMVTSLAIVLPHKQIVFTQYLLEYLSFPGIA